MRRGRAFLFGISLLASTRALATPTIDVDGWCPDVTITLTDATPRREVMLFTGELDAATTLAHGTCAGTVMAVADANRPSHQLLTARAGASGEIAFSPATIGPGGCDAAVQALDVATCEVSEPVPLTLDCSTMENDLLAYWPGNGHARDVVGSHRGTIEGTLAYAPGVYGDAFEFDGRTSIRVVPTSDLDFGYGVPFTYAMWIYDETSSSNPHHLFGKRAGCAGGNAFDYQYVVQFGYQGGGAYGCGAAASFQPPVDTWLHVVSMYDGVEWSLYIDGELEAESAECTEAQMPVLGGPLRIGSSGTCAILWDQGWIGRVDDVKLWNRALTDDEILCASGPGPH